MNVSITPGEAEVMKRPMAWPASTACVVDGNVAADRDGSLSWTGPSLVGNWIGGGAGADVVRKLVRLGRRPIGLRGGPLKPVRRSFT